MSGSGKVGPRLICNLLKSLSLSTALSLLSSWPSPPFSTLGGSPATLQKTNTHQILLPLPKVSTQPLWAKSQIPK